MTARPSLPFCWFPMLSLVVTLQGCGRGHRFSLAGIDCWCIVDRQLSLVWCREEGVDLVKLGSSNHRMKYSRIRYDEVRYSLPDQTSSSHEPLRPTAVVNMADLSAPRGVSHLSPLELSEKLGLGPRPQVVDPEGLPAGPRGKAEAWLTVNHFQRTNALLWKDRQSGELWLLGGNPRRTGVLNLGSGFGALTQDPAIGLFWDPGNGAVLFAYCTDLGTILRFPSRVVLWHYRTGTRAEYTLIPPEPWPPESAGSGSSSQPIQP